MDDFGNVNTRPQTSGEDAAVGNERESLMPSYHDLHITTAHIERTSIFNLPYGYEVHCTRMTGWLLYDNGARLSPHLAQPEPGVLAGEYEGPDKWLVLDVDGHVILDSRRTSEDDDDG